MPKKKSTRRKDGRYQVKVQNKFFYGKTSAEAERKAAEYRRQMGAGLSIDAHKITVAQYASRWLPLHKSNVSHNTYNSYASILDKVIGLLGAYSCYDIRPDDAKRVYVELFPPKKSPGDKEGCSASQIRKAHMLCVALFDSAVENGLCTRNPFRSKSAKPEYGEDGSHREITDEERQAILDSNHWFKPAVMAMLYAGLRRGEAIALDRSTDVAPDLSSLTISSAIHFEGNRAVVGNTKTSSGVRTIPVFLPLKPYLVGSGLLVSSQRAGKEMTQSAFKRAWESYVADIERDLNGGIQKRWYGLTKEAKQANPEKHRKIMHLIEIGQKEKAEELRLSDWKTFTVRPHDLRHSFCTMCRDAGVDIKQTITWMGHADEKMVLRIYDHPGAKRAYDSTKKVENLLSGCQNGCQDAK